MIRIFLWTVLALLAALPVQAQTRTVRETQELINWYYAATFGTGVYTAGDRTVAVLQLPFSHTLRQAGDGRYGLRIKVPVTFGFYDYSFDNVFSGDLPEKLSTVSVLPGLEWEMPLNPRWTIKPFFSAGAGQELTGRESALLYDFGVKSRYLVGEDKGVEFSLVNALTASGYRPRGGPRQPFGVLSIGVDLVIPTKQVLFGRDAFIGFTPIYSYYFNKVLFAEFTDADNYLREQFELSISLMSRKPWTLKYVDVDRIGLSFRSSGEIFGISLFTSLPF